MISYKYNIYHSKKTKYLDKMLRECCFVWNHALALQRRYYKLFGKYISVSKMKKHFAKRIKRNLLHSQTVQEILERLDESYNRFFKKLAKRPPKSDKDAERAMAFLKEAYPFNEETEVFIRKRYNMSIDVDPEENQFILNHFVSY